MKHLLLFFAALIPPACATAPAPAADALIRLEKGGCGYMAACPAFAISMTPDGRYRYEGFKNVPLLGVREGQLPPGAWRKAEAAFEAADWRNLGDPTAREGGFPCMPDSPVAKITKRVRAGEEKLFTYNLGCDSVAGNALLTALGEILPDPQAP